MYRNRSIQTYIFSSFESSFVTTILGPRRVGKTTLVKSYINNHPDHCWVSLNMDSVTQRIRVIEEDLHNMIQEEALAKIGGDKKIWVFIDEAQKCPELFEQIKIIYDDYKGQDKIKFIMTGSAHLDLHKLAAESLAGRVDLIRLREFNSRELSLMLKPSVDVPNTSAFDLLTNDFNLKEFNQLESELQPFNKLIQEAIANHLIWGGLPEVYEQTSENEKWKYLSNYLQTYLEKDVRPIESINDIVMYHNLMKITAEQTGSLRDDKKIIEALGCARNTLNKYRGFLKSTMQYTEIYPYINSSVKRLVKSPKAYLTNNGLVSYFTGIKAKETLEITGLLGHRFENWFLNELKSWLDRQTDHHLIQYWRTTSQAEVDFVLTFGASVIPFEITCGTKISTQKVRHLTNFLEEEKKAKQGIYVYNGKLKYDADKRILFLPAWMI